MTVLATTMAFAPDLPHADMLGGGIDSASGGRTILDFEGIVPGNAFAPLSSYAGFDWSELTVIGKRSFAAIAGWGTDNGLWSVIRGKGVVYANEQPGGIVDSTFAPSNAGATFSLIGGRFASVWNDGESVTFHAMRDGVEVGSKTATLDVSVSHIKFGKQFADIDAVRITADWSAGGVDHNPSDLQEGLEIALDNLKIVLNEPSPAGAHDFIAQQLAAHPIGGTSHHDWSDMMGA
jgi:hypothetical protein